MIDLLFASVLLWDVGVGSGTKILNRWAEFKNRIVQLLNMTLGKAWLIFF